MKKLLFYLSTLAALIFISCEDGDSTGTDITENNESILILNEGAYNKNNSTLTKYNPFNRATFRDYFNLTNKRGLGDVGNDMILYGSKLYIVINISGTIEVVDPTTGLSIKQIPMKTEDGASKQPRQITSYDGKIYVTSYDDTVSRIDTTTLTVDATIEVGMDPDGIVAQNGKLYVANSGGLNYFDGYNNTLSVIDAATFTVIDEIEVAVNPTNIDADNRGNVYISALGNYFDQPAVFQKLETAAGTVTTIEEITSPGKFLIHDNKAYIVQGSYGTSYSVVVFDCVTEEVVAENFITDGTQIDIIYSISIDPKTGDLFIMESDYIIPGSVYCFDKQGKLKYSIIAVGLNPNTVIVL
jgi:YVTN family beta-propeller protein